MKKKSANITKNDRQGCNPPVGACGFGWKTLCLGALCFFLSSCSTYSSRIREPRDLFEQGKYDEAIAKLEEYRSKKDGDYLLYLLDLGIVYHGAGRYQKAIETFREAEKIAEIKDYTSLIAESASVLLNENIKDYRAEHFETVLINVYLAIDYTLLGQWEDALVECRRVNHILDRMIREGKLPYEHNAFAKYLSAALFEAQNEYNDAWIDYRQLEKWAGNFPYLPGPLLRVTDKLKNLQELSEYLEKYPDQKGKYKLKKDEGEVILIVEQGRAPYKIPNPEFHLLPKFTRNHYPSDSVWLRDKEGKIKARSFPLFDIEQTAIHELGERTAGIIAKKVGGIVLKQAAAYGVEKATNSKELGAITAILLHLTDQADLRSWTTLPARLQIARMAIPSGRHDLLVDMVSGSGSVSPGVKTWAQVEIKAGRKIFLHYRTPDR